MTAEPDLSARGRLCPSQRERDKVGVEPHRITISHRHHSLEQRRLRNIGGPGKCDQLIGQRIDNEPVRSTMDAHTLILMYEQHPPQRAFTCGYSGTTTPTHASHDHESRSRTGFADASR